MPQSIDAASQRGMTYRDAGIACPDRDPSQPAPVAAGVGPIRVGDTDNITR
jgi:hypothetical protein